MRKGSHLRDCAWSLPWLTRLCKMPPDRVLDAVLMNDDRNLRARAAMGARIRSGSSSFAHATGDCDAAKPVTAGRAKTVLGADDVPARGNPDGQGSAVMSAQNLARSEHVRRTLPKRRAVLQPEPRRAWLVVKQW